VIVPRLSFSKTELSQGVPEPERVRDAVEKFRKAGILVIDNLLPPVLIDSLNSAFIARYKRYFSEAEQSGALQVGDRRKMVTVAVDGAFNNPFIYANPLVMPIVETILGEKFILNGFGAVVSLPGSKEQHIHRDYPGLFHDERFDRILPSFCLTMIIPLVPIDEVVGGTRVWPGSHRVTDREAESQEYHDLELALGSCFLFDATLVHGGQPNRSSVPRPIMYNVYSKPWFRDDFNYAKQKSLIISKKEFMKVEARYQHLFAWAFAAENPRGQGTIRRKTKNSLKRLFSRISRG